MKKVIDKKIYDTDTATNIAEWGNTYPSSDFHYCHETLYRTAKGAWFLRGAGGPLSKYAIACGNARGYGDDIVALTADEAYAWLEEHNELDVIAEYFADRVEEA